MNSHLLTLIAAATSCFTIAASAQIYKVTDEDGAVIFTDQPATVTATQEQDIEEVELPELNTASPVEARPAPPPSSAPRVEAAPKPTVTISSPVNETTIAMGPGNFTVSASVDPALSRSERLLLYVDGQPVGSAQSSATWFIEGALRGPHDLVVHRTNAQGKTLVTSETVRVYVLRPSVIRR
ncbi:MAG: DUF4124 domain-containing protein [Pseudomonadota bacterium]